MLHSCRPRLLGGILLMTVAPAACAVGKATAAPVDYAIDFTTLSGPSVGSGTFMFDSMGQTSTTIGPPADLVNLSALVGGTPYTGTSPTDDSAVVDSMGLVTSTFADLEPASNPAGNVLQLFSTGNTYQLLDPTMTNVLGNGSYVIAAVPEPGSMALLAAGFLGSAGLLLRKRRR